jgi:hypothetical protein
MSAESTSKSKNGRQKCAIDTSIPPVGGCKSVVEGTNVAEENLKSACTRSMCSILSSIGDELRQFSAICADSRKCRRPTGVRRHTTRHLRIVTPRLSPALLLICRAIHLERLSTRSTSCATRLMRPALRLQPPVPQLASGLMRSQRVSLKRRTPSIELHQLTFHRCRHQLWFRAGHT